MAIRRDKNFLILKANDQGIDCGQASDRDFGGKPPATQPGLPDAMT